MDLMDLKYKKKTKCGIRLLLNVLYFYLYFSLKKDYTHVCHQSLYKTHCFLKIIVAIFSLG